MENEVHPATDTGGSHQRGFGRRTLFGAGLGGTAALVLGRSGAGASAPPPGETTTLPPKRPTTDDIQLLGFVQGAEMAAAVLYAKSLGITSATDTQHKVLAVAAQSHKSYGQALAGFLGRSAPNAVDQSVVDTFASEFDSGDLDRIIAVARKLESTLVATHIDVIGKLQGTDAANLLASIVTIEGRHGTVLADMAGAKGLADLLVEVEAEKLAIAQGGGK